MGFYAYTAKLVIVFISAVAQAIAAITGIFLMKPDSFLFRFFSSSWEMNISVEQRGKVFFIYAMAITLLISFPPLMYQMYSIGHFSQVIILLMALVSFLVSSLIIRLSRKVFVGKIIASSGTIISAGYVIFFGGYHNYGFLFMYLIPYILYFLLDYKVGFFANLFILVIYIFTLLNPEIAFFQESLDDDLVLRLIFTYLILNVITFIVSTLHFYSNRQVEYLAFYDQLTGLPNRYRFEERLDKAIQDANRRKENLYAVMINVDRFKRINDTYGPHIGDLILINLARRLEDFRDNVSELQIYEVSHHGGSDFQFFFSPAKSGITLDAWLELLQRELSLPIKAGEQWIQFSVSIGIAKTDPLIKDRISLLKNLELSMSKAKEVGPGSTLFYDDIEHQDYREKFVLGELLKNALQNGEIYLEYQPQINYAKNKIIGFEVLVRWKNPELGSIAPDIFIPIAEEEGIIHKLSDWIIVTAWKELREIEIAMQESYRISINISPIHLGNPGFLYNLELAIKEHKIRPDKIDFELTEGILLDDNIKIIEVLRRIKYLGFSLSLDDFGTGYSSLSYLKKFNVNMLKIDQSFVHNLKGDHINYEIVRAIIAIAKSLNLDILAEGIEFKEQLDLIKELGCDLFQGFYFSHPLNKRDLLEYLIEQRFSLI